MKTKLYLISFLLLAATALQAQDTASTKPAMQRQHPDTVEAKKSNIVKTFTDLFDLPLAFDAAVARRSINVSSFLGMFTNNGLAASVKLFTDESAIKIGLTESVEMDNKIWHVFDVKTAKPAIDKSSETYMIFHLDFIPKEGNPRLYRIRFKIDTMYAISTNFYTKDNWDAFNEYIGNINNDSVRNYTRTQFASAVDEIITKGFFILLGIKDYPLSVDIKPLSPRGIDTVLNRTYTGFLYETIIVDNKSKPVTNVALKQGDQLSLHTVVNRLEIDSVDRTITLNNNNKVLTHQLSSLDSAKTVTYTATSKGDDAITASYEIEYEGKKIVETLGKLNISIYEQKSFKVQIVPINISQTVNANAIKGFLDSVYGQAVVFWDVTVEQALQVSGFNGRLKHESGSWSNYSSDMNSIINAYKKERKVENNTYYIFLVNQFENTGIAGFMPMKRNYGFVSYGSSHTIESLARTIAHELGHGTFRLRHTFSEYPSMIQGSTYNLMDYVYVSSDGTELGRSQLFKYQWDLIHNPAGGLYWFQDEEDAMALDGNLPDRYSYDPYLFFLSFVRDDRNWLEGFVVNSSKKVAIDPGHGDWPKATADARQIDPGTVSGDDYEKDWVLQISVAMKNRLKQRGVEILMTREDDIILDGERILWRIEKAHEDSCDIFVSIHIDSEETGHASGFSVFHKENHEKSNKLAQCILKKQTSMNLHGSGIKTRNFSVLRNFKGEAAVLIEVGFITNEQDLNRIKNNYRNIGIEIADGVCDYLMSN